MREPYGFKELKLTDFFEVISGKSDKNYKKEGKYPLISATREDNGIIGYVDEPVNKTHSDEITMANRGSSGVTFLQIGEFAHTNTAFVLKKKEDFTINQLLYFVGVLNKLDYEGYTKYPTMTSLREDKLLLPITEEGTPDYEYMEEYIDHIKGEYVDKLEESHREEYHQLEALGLDDGAIELEEPYGYEYINVGELFKVRSGGRVTRKNQIEGDIPYVTAVTTNNGIENFISNPIFTQEDILTVNFFGNVFYHPYKVAYKDGTYGLESKSKLTKNQKLYIGSSIQKQTLQMGDYNNAIRVKDLRELEVYLPITPEGTPDYEYMEDYITYIKGEYVDKLEESHREEYRQLEALGLDEGAIELEEPYGYEEFELDNMFERVQTGYIGEGSYQENSQEEKTEEFPLPLLSAKYDNNGILFYGRPEEWRTYRNVLGVVTSGAVAAGLVYAYKDYVSVRSTAYLLKMKNKEYKDNFKVLQYLATALEKTLFGRYTRDYAPIWGRILQNKEKIKLPSTPEGTPDYEYMENYIKHIAYTYRMNRRDEQEEEIRQLRKLI